MPIYLLRVEGVNLRSVIWDTDDLSTRRGGGLMLLNAVAQLRDQFSALDLKSVATGASIGLFTFTADAASAEKVRSAVEDHFRRHGSLEYTDESDGGIGHLPLKHGIICAVGTYVVAQTVFIIIRAIGGNEIRWLAAIFNLTAVAVAGLVGGAIGGMMHRRGFYPSSNRSSS